MKVLHLFRHYLPATQNWAYRLLRHTPEVEIHIAANHYLKQNFYAPDFTFVDNHLDDSQVLDYSLNARKPREFLKKLALKSLPFLVGSYENRILQHVRKHKIDLLHAHFAPVAWQYRKLARRTKLPFVVSFYGYDYERLPFTQPEFQERYRLLFQQAQAFICEGSHGGRILDKMGCPREKIHMAPLGVEVDQIPFFQREKRAQNLRLLQLASFTEKKGHLDTLRAFAAALPSCPNMRLSLVGNEKEKGRKEKIQKFIFDRQLADKVELKEPLPYEQLYQFLKGFDVFIHPSHYTADRDCEGGAPVVLLDAQATGLPVIATTHCDIPALVRDGEGGVLSPEKDWQALAESIKTFYHMPPESYSKFAKKAREQVESNYSITENAKKLLKVYREVLI